jgi:hypothetical protein
MNHTSPSPNAKRPPFNPNLAALQNITPEWHDILAKLGLDVLLVSFRANRHSPIWKHPEIGKGLGEELKQARAGQFDSMMMHAGTMLCFFHVHDLGRAAAALKRQIEIRGLLPITQILHRETPNAWRCYWSPEGREIAQIVKDEAE